MAIKGYDVVAYRTIDSAVQGNSEYQFVWKGAKWLFLSEENRRRFAENPESYEPEYDGYCAWSVTNGAPMESDPQQWKIVNGKLYLIQNGQVKEVWEKNSSEFIKKSDANWQKIKEKKQN